MFNILSLMPVDNSFVVLAYYMCNYSDCGHVADSLNLKKEKQFYHSPKKQTFLSSVYWDLVLQSGAAMWLSRLDWIKFCNSAFPEWANGLLNDV